MHWPELRPEKNTRIGLRLKLTNAMRVVTQDFGRKSKLKFLVVTQVCSCVKPVVTLEGPLYITPVPLYPTQIPHIVCGVEHDASVVSCRLTKRLSKNLKTDKNYT
jgi:hypothetical protein